MFGLHTFPAIAAGLVGAAGTVTAVGVLWNKFVRPLWRGLRRGEQVWESVNTIEPFKTKCAPSWGRCATSGSS